VNASKAVRQRRIIDKAEKVVGSKKKGGWACWLRWNILRGRGQKSRATSEKGEKRRRVEGKHDVCIGKIRTNWERS